MYAQAAFGSNCVQLLHWFSLFSKLKKFLQATNPDFVRGNKTRGSERLVRGKSQDELDKGSEGAQWSVPLVEALFLPDFPVRGSLEEQEFEVVDVIAKGAYGNVLRVRREDEKQVYAMKVMSKTQIIVEGAIQQCKDEAAIQAMLGDHPFIVKLHEYWQSKKFLYIVLDYIPYGDTFTLWTFHGYFPEQLVKVFVAEMAMVLDYLHKSGVIYRDIKMENILLDVNGHIQLTDFGLSKWLNIRERTRTVCGTLQYMAPEVLSAQAYGHTADWWSLGILMFVMLAGKYPAEGASDHKEMATKVFDCDYLLPNFVSDRAQEVIDKLLMKRPERRLSDLFTLQNMPFYRLFDFTSAIERKINPKTVVPEDFFPMTGVSFSYSPNTEPPEEDEFAEFDFVWNLPSDAEPVFV
ncbi:serine/threonine-protein kinase S6KL-like isoform X1 [Mizuhopecten yessoensis]|uniref:serine/threonine-protein kinase S6KL-like isoform X1 n=1 Tax=Mizuhopecten yessoensis TaxID=6573 RepID=UPI000B458B4C|nr:serine/threonine-protein kinase S6KL-like isoform X1 [Mizuhopecten yessoensis]